MIYNKNRISSIGETTAIEVNENYLGTGALYFMEECAEDELDIFASAIASDSKEFALGEAANSEAINALNESFVETAKNKIKEMMTKFIEWVESVFKSAYANLQTTLIKGNALFAKEAKKRLDEKKDDFKVEGTYLDHEFSVKDLKAELNRAKKLKEIAEGLGGDITKEDVKTNFSSASKNMKNYTKTGTIGRSVVNDQINLLNKIAGNMKEIKSVMDDAKKNANEIIKKSKDIKDTKEDANDAVKAASMYRQMVQAIISYSLKMIKAQTKVARQAINKALGMKKKEAKDNKSEKVEESAMLNELDMITLECDYNLDEALESCTKHEDCDDCDDCENDDDDIDSDDIESEEE